IVAKGGRWLDVRLPSEYQTLAIEGALNIPLYLIRLKLSTLDPAVPYVAYCDTGRRSSAAAYLMVERGFDAYVLTGGLSNGGASAPGAAAPAKAAAAPKAPPAAKPPGLR
ncbi:MAG TPA: rhodanese-like domain-containing protein, partial [Steroidobacteraceae bacterium]|nr:rhodanese-like domain-containing protein [Steroidobacteraceae bacterium]